ncbi:SDR family oxidoreductase [Cobetia sp. ICG0124]|uniref:SDR family oxidoreductase n=1 Tax=Cobetia sp. ICG0124 TaxID=2053669 RepID=UPI001F0C2452|nr:SDR family oxidoreductase [Cobetia sp. ICG0124]
MSYEQWREVINCNLDSVFNTCRAVINDMLEHKYGRIVNISSINGRKGQFGQVNYSAAKAATKGITVNTLSPGYIATDMIMKIPEEIRESIRETIPVKRYGQPDEIARAVAFLADEKSGFITGANLDINGGQFMG